jgi:hypothetical protein
VKNERGKAVDRKASAPLNEQEGGRLIERC